MDLGADGDPARQWSCTTDLQVPLDSIRQICDTGATVTFTSQGGTIVGPAYALDFERRGDTYVRPTWVKVPRTSAEAQANAVTTSAVEAYAVGPRRLLRKTPRGQAAQEAPAPFFAVGLAV